MRIVSGEFRGTKLETPLDNNIRPTMDRAKEGIFSSLAFLVNQAEVLDLFAGTGNLGIECLSRGAISCDFVDQSDAAIKLINTNLSKCKLNQKVIKQGVKSYIDSCQKKYDLIFLDPPYDINLEDINGIIEQIYTNELLYEDGRIILEFETSRVQELDFEQLIKVKKYGKSTFLILGE